MCKHVAMLKYLSGILLIQAVTVVMVIFAPDNLQGVEWLRLLIPVLVTGVIAAFWFAAIAKHHSKDQLATLQQRHAREREKIQISAERAKTRLVKQTQQQISREARITHARANFKVGAAFAGAIGMGALMLLTEFLTLGILTLSTAGGALGGYLYRGKREKQSSSHQATLISEGVQDEMTKAIKAGKQSAANGAGQSTSSGRSSISSASDRSASNPGRFTKRLPEP